MSISTNLDGVTQIGTWNFNLSQVGGANFVLGPNTQAYSLPVTIASDQPAIPVSISGAVSISGTVPVTFDPTQVVITSLRDPAYITNLVIGDAVVPVVVSLIGSDINNIVNPVTIASSSVVGVTQQTSPWTENVAQFGGAAVATGVGPGGAGVPRVTISNDSVISGITNPVTVTGSLAFAGTGPQMSAQSTSVVIAPDQVVPVTVRDPIQVVNPSVNDQTVPLVVQLASSDINNIISPVSIANFPTTQPVSISGAVPVTPATGEMPSNINQVNGAAPSAANPLPVQVSNGVGFTDSTTLLSILVQLQVIQLNLAASRQNSDAGFFPLEVPPMLGA